jgi:hypothetical protein
MAARPAAADDVHVTVGKVRTARFHTEVRRVQVASSDTRIVRAQYREGYGVQVKGMAPGEADVTVTGEIVRYETGIPNPDAVPVARYTPFQRTYHIVVEPDTAPEPKVREVRRRVLLQVGQTKRQYSWVPSRNVRWKIADAGLVGVSFRPATGLEVTGLRSGVTEVVAEGVRVELRDGHLESETVRYLYQITVTEKEE